MFLIKTVSLPRTAKLTAKILCALADCVEKAVPEESQKGVIMIAAVDAETIRRWNRTYRKKDTETDVLSFRYVKDFSEADSREVVGEILIHPEMVARQAVLYGNTLSAEWCKLVIHGLFHIVGFDHETEDQFQKMLPLENAAAHMMQKKFGIEIR